MHGIEGKHDFHPAISSSRPCFPNNFFTKRFKERIKDHTQRFDREYNNCDYLCHLVMYLKWPLYLQQVTFQLFSGEKFKMPIWAKFKVIMTFEQWRSFGVSNGLQNWKPNYCWNHTTHIFCVMVILITCKVWEFISPYGTLVLFSPSNYKSLRRNKVVSEHINF